jgi:hypothetical protein
VTERQKVQKVEDAYCQLAAVLEVVDVPGASLAAFTFLNHPFHSGFLGDILDRAQEIGEKLRAPSVINAAR